MLFFKKKEKTPIPKKKHIKHSYLIKIGKVRRRDDFHIDQFLNLFEDFIDEFYNIKYERSIKELKKDLKDKKIKSKIREELYEFLDQLLELRYNPSKINLVEIHEIIDEANDLIKRM